MGTRAAIAEALIEPAEVLLDLYGRDQLTFGRGARGEARSPPCLRAPPLGPPL